MLARYAIIAALFSATPASADIAVRFIEGAPKDRFVFEASSTFCAMVPLKITLDLTGSAGALLFDVAQSGAGVEVYQPFEVVAGADVLLGASSVADGDRRLTIELASLQPGKPFAFTIDVDDTLGGREITVAGSEILGAVVSVQAGDETRVSAFDEAAIANIDWSTCQS